MKLKSLTALLFCSLLFGCTDAKMGKFMALGNDAKVTCYSGGKVIYDGVSSGKIENQESSDGYYFTPKGESLAVEVSGDCIIKYID